MPPVFALSYNLLSRARNRKKPSSAVCTARSQHFNINSRQFYCAHGKPSHFIVLANHKFIKFAKFSHVRWCDGKSLYGVQDTSADSYRTNVRCALTHACLKARIIKIKHKVVFNWTRCWHLMCTHTHTHLRLWEKGTRGMRTEHSVDLGYLCLLEQWQNYMHFMVIGDSWSLQLEDLVTSV